MDELISRQALLDKFEPWLKVKDYNDGELNMLKAILYEIRFMRSAQPETSQVARDIARIVENEQDMRILPKRGRWIDKGERGDWEWQADGRGRHWHEWECNKCHHYFDERTFFCPHCGADMREVTT